MICSLPSFHFLPHAYSSQCWLTFLAAQPWAPTPPLPTTNCNKRKPEQSLLDTNGEAPTKRIFCIRNKWRQEINNFRGSEFLTARLVGFCLGECRQSCSRSFVFKGVTELHKIRKTRCLVRIEREQNYEQSIKTVIEDNKSEQCRSFFFIPFRLSCGSSQQSGTG